MVRRGPESVCEAEKWAPVKLHSSSASDSLESEGIERGGRGLGAELVLGERGT